MATKIGEQLQSVFLKCTSAFTMEGLIVRAGQIVEMVEEDAKSLLARGKAELATIEHAIAAGLVGADAVDRADADPATSAGQTADVAPAAADAGAAAPTATADAPVDTTAAASADAAAPQS